MGGMGMFLKTMNDLFCGAGGMGKGFVQAGWEVVGAFDWDKYAVQSYNANVGEHAVQADIKALKWFHLEKATGWTFGFPCQDISRARMDECEGLKGKKSGHFYEIMRLLEETRENAPDYLPAFILAENVEDLGKELPEVERAYKEKGYVMQVKLFNSKHWVPQSRSRYFIVGIREDLAQNFSFPEQPDEAHWLIKHLDSEPSEELYYSMDGYETFPSKPFNAGELNQIGVIKRKGWLDSTGRIYSPFGVAPTLTTCQGGHRQAKILCPIRNQPRKLSAMEYARLQGFKDFERAQVSGKKFMSDAQIYKQMGNAVTVDVAEANALALGAWVDSL